MNSPFSAAVAQIATGQSLDQWYQPQPAKEKLMPAAKPKADTGRIRDDIVALFKPDAWMKKAEIAEALGVSSDFLTFHLGKLIADKELIATGSTGNRAFALPSAAEREANERQAPKPKAKSVKRNKSAAKSRLTKPSPAAIGKLRAAVADIPPSTPLTQAVAALMVKRDKIDDAITALRAVYTL